MIRLILAVVLLLLSLLVLFRAPTNFFWRVAVAVTEFPYVFFLAGLFLFVSCFWSTQYKMISMGMSGLAMILYSLPVFFAYQRGARMPGELAKVFPSATNATQLQQPFSLIKMFSGIGIKEIVPQQLVYKQVDGKNFVIDFYSATEKTKVPCVIVIHGGSWSGGDEKQLPELNSYLAYRGYHVAAINYRLAPLYRSPAPVEIQKLQWNI